MSSTRRITSMVRCRQSTCRFPEPGPLRPARERKALSLPKSEEQRRKIHCKWKERSSFNICAIKLRECSKDGKPSKSMLSSMS